MLLGVAAARLYPELDQVDAFRIFHSGQVLFDDGLPVDDTGNIGLPVPLSLHRKKGEAASDRTIMDFAKDQAITGYSQWRDQALSSGLRQVEIFHTTTLRTAIDPKTGRAEDSRLFGLQALCADQRFVASIEAEEKDMERLLPALLGERILGRSKSGEFGRVVISECPEIKLALDNNDKGCSYAWFLSDVWAHDQNGLPSERPEETWFGPDARINWSYSFIRSRSFSPYNSAWHRRGVGRTVLERGSVLVINNGNLKAGIHRLGLGQELGYGKVLISARAPIEVLQSGIFDMHVPRGNDEKVCQDPQSDFSNWLQARAKVTKSRRSTADQIPEYLALAMTHYKNADRRHFRRIGPKVTQWAALEECVARGGDISSILGTSHDHQWGARFGQNQKDTFRNWIETLLLEPEGNRNVRLVAREVRRELERSKWFDD